MLCSFFKNYSLFSYFLGVCAIAIPFWPFAISAKKERESTLAPSGLFASPENNFFNKLLKILKIVIET